MPARTARRVALALLAGLPAAAQEIELRNDSLQDGSNAYVCPCFTPSEEAAVWLTSPCDGAIVAFRIFWKSQFGGTEPGFEDAIVVYQGGSFPVPGPVIDTFEGPVLQDGGLNEFRFRDDEGVIPINVPVSAGQTFVVALRFFNDNRDISAASVISDADGCTQGRNAVKVNGNTWTNSCDLLILGGDWVIRAMVECDGAAPGACCLPDGSCAGLTRAECLAAGGLFNGEGTLCADVACEGACFVPATGNCLPGFEKTLCDSVGGQWQGPGTTTCTPACPADLGGIGGVGSDGTLDIFDILAFFDLYAASDSRADFSGPDGRLDIFDILAFFNAYAAGC